MSGEVIGFRLFRATGLAYIQSSVLLYGSASAKLSRPSQYQSGMAVSSTSTTRRCTLQVKVQLFWFFFLGWFFGPLDARETCFGQFSSACVVAAAYAAGID